MRFFCCAVSPHDYILILQDEEVQSTEMLLRKYFHLGFPYMEILAFLSKFHEILLNLRQIKCLLSAMGLSRRRKQLSVRDS